MPLKTFYLIRDVDVSGVSGTGKVAVGVEFPDGTAVLHWLTEIPSTTIYESVSDVEKVHGHGGATRVVFEGPDDSYLFQQGRAEGRSDVVSMLRKIIDPDDTEHLSLDGVLDKVRLIKFLLDADERIYV